MLRSAVFALLPLAAVCVAQNSTGVDQTINVDEFPKDVITATAWSLIYTYPLVIFANFVGSVLQHVSFNQIYHQRNLASPDDPGVIKPNVDTLYSRVALDLSSQDIVLTVPEINDGRYWNYPLYDPYGNNIAEIGVVNGNKGGDYLLRRADDAFVAPGFTNESAPCVGCYQYRGIVNVPTAYATMLIRLLVKANTTEDLQALHTYQNASKLTPIPRQVSNALSLQAPDLGSLAPNGSFLGIEGPDPQLNFASRLLPYTQAEVYSDRQRINSILTIAGIYNGTYHPQSSVNLTQATVVANNSITADVTDPSHIRDQGNNWQLSIPSYQGDFTTHYAPAAYVALAGYQQQSVRQTLYPGFGSLGFTSKFSLPSNGSLLVTFSAKPKVNTVGFWSLSVYGSDQYLVPNPLNRFELGDRSFNLTYQDGTGTVYGPDADVDHDGPYQILVQRVNQPPPTNWTGNWLPTSEDGIFSWILRWYVPEDAMTNGTYVYPTVQNITAIV